MQYMMKIYLGKYLYKYINITECKITIKVVFLSIIRSIYDILSYSNMNK